MKQNTLMDIVAFSPRSLQSPNAWIGHLPFAAWLIQEVSPKIFVELGTHSGNSYFTFCQSIASADLSTKSYAVDTWTGDEYSGQYEDEIFVKVNAHNQEHYAAFSRLLRMTFDDAVTYFTDESIDLLHIDGRHDFESVSHDFNTWLPKLAPGAVVIFHDTNVRERNFGVWKLWEALQALYPNNLEFVPSHGLGVLQLNNAPEDKKLPWLQADSPEKQQLINCFAVLGSRQLELYELKQLVANRDVHVANLSQLIEKRNRQLANRHQAVANRDIQIANRNRSAAERDGRIANLHLTQIERNKQIATMSQAITERDLQINTLNQTVVDRNEQITVLSQAVTECELQISTLNQTVVERIEQITVLSQAVTERDLQISTLNQTVVDRNEQIATMNQVTTARDEQIANLNQVELSYAEALRTIEEIRRSTSWKATVPIRLIASKARNLVSILKLLPNIIRFGGGVRKSAKKSWRVFSREGWAGVKQRILFVGGHRSKDPNSMIRPDKALAAVDRNDYTEWVRRYDTLKDSDREKIATRIAAFQCKPLISVLMPVYNPPIAFLDKAIHSVRKQLYSNWELCIADDDSTNPAVRELLQRHAANDSRIKVIYRKTNGHISAASNSALSLVTGEYVALLDHDDLLREHALFWVADAIVNNSEAGLIYSDEDKIDQSGLRYDPYFKPDWNPDLFLSHNMICHLGVYRTDLVRNLGGFREGFDGSQDYDLALRCIEQLSVQQIVHIPRVLYHWRSHPGSTAQAGSEKNYALLAGEHALNDHFARTLTSARAELLDFDMYRVRYNPPSSESLVSLIIPTRNGLNLIKQCIESIFAKTTYHNYEILIVDNNSDDPDTLDYFASLSSGSRIRIIRDERPFNFSALNNAAVEHAHGEYLGLINNDIEVISPDWLTEMMSFAIQPGVGAVGARLWYPNNTLQHGGVITGLGKVAGHAHKHFHRDAPGFFNRARLIQTMSVVTAACLVIKKSIYQQVNGLDETSLKVAFNDVDFCLRVREAGYRNVWTPYAELYHHESATRGYEDTPEKQLRFKDEINYMKERWGSSLRRDPAYNPNLTLDREDFSLAWPPRIRQ